jgi:crotonobetainyl-CoA:carnitine CoA-transferase CaiB-like acyl-CoA transferase
LNKIMHSLGGVLAAEKLSGVRVLEVAEYVIAPSAGAVLADWGADVIKVEHATRGDAIRGLRHEGMEDIAGGFHFIFDPFNRSKRSIGLDLATSEGQSVLLELAKLSDVFLCNFLPATREKLGITAEDIQTVNPKIIYAMSTAFGLSGPRAGERGYDALTYWYGTGAAMSGMLASSLEPAPLPGPAFGDCQTGMALAGGIAAALFHRERTGEGSTVDVSLYAAGLWAMTSSLVGANIRAEGTGSVWDKPPWWDRTNAYNPLFNIYGTSDRRFIALNMLQPDAYWSSFCKVIGRADLSDDPRFATIDPRTENRRECISELDKTFGAQPLAHWEVALRDVTGPWTVVKKVEDLNSDAHAWENGYLQRVDYGDGRALTMTSTPVQFDGTPAVLRPAPVHAANTEEILLELGFDWDEIGKLQQSGAIT